MPYFPPPPPPPPKPWWARVSYGLGLAVTFGALVGFVLWLFVLLAYLFGCLIFGIHVSEFAPVIALRVSMSIGVFIGFLIGVAAT